MGQKLRALEVPIKFLETILGMGAGAHVEVIGNDLPVDIKIVSIDASRKNGHLCLVVASESFSAVEAFDQALVNGPRLVIRPAEITAWCKPKEVEPKFREFT